MSIIHHPDPSTLIAYSAGSIGEVLAAVVSAHLDHCRTCRLEVARLTEFGGAMVETAPVTELASDALDRALLRLDETASVGTIPAAAQPTPISPLRVVEQLLGCPIEQAKWRRIAPGVQQIRLKTSPAAKGALKLLRIGAGRAIPDHGHGGAEMTLVLKGAYVDRFGRFAAGDVADLDADVDHEPTVEAGAECICLVASEHQTRFKGRLMRLLQPILRV